MGISLQKKFILVAFLSVLVVTLAISLLAAIKTRSALYNASERQGRMLAETVSALIINQLIYEKLGLVEEGALIDNYMRDLSQHSELDLNFVAVLDTTSRVISHSDFQEYGKKYDDTFIKQAQKSDQVLIKSSSSAEGGNDNAALEFAAPLSIEGKRWGYSFFHFHLQMSKKKSRQ